MSGQGWKQPFSTDRRSGYCHEHRSFDWLRIRVNKLGLARDLAAKRGNFQTTGTSAKIAVTKNCRECTDFTSSTVDGEYKNAQIREA